jgi:energy-coupling factor transporter ATP-binding protein EcfA2
MQQITQQFLTQSIVQDVFSTAISYKKVQRLVAVDVDDQASQFQGQQAILTAIDHARHRFVNEGLRIALLNGEAGTGKTHVLSTTLKNQVFKEQSTIFPVVLQLTAPVPIANYEEWLIKSIFNELDTRHFDTQDNRSPLQRLGSAILAHTDSGECEKFLQYRDDDNDELMIEQARKIGRQLQRQAKQETDPTRQLSSPLPASFVAVILLAANEHQSAQNYLQYGVIDSCLAPLCLPPVEHAFNRLDLIHHLDLVIHWLGGVLVLAFDQVEQANKQSSIDATTSCDRPPTNVALLAHIFSQVVNIAMRTEATALIVAIINDAYDDLRASSQSGLNQSYIDRIENEIPMMTRLRRPDAAFLRNVIMNRLNYCAQQLQWSDEETKQLLPEWLLNQASTERSVRRTLNQISRYVKLGRQIGGLPDQNTFKQTYQIDSLDHDILTTETDWGKLWADFYDSSHVGLQTYLVHEKARLLGDYVTEIIHEHPDLSLFNPEDPSKRCLRYLNYDQTTDQPCVVDYILGVRDLPLIRRQIALCDASNRGHKGDKESYDETHTKLYNQIEDFITYVPGDPIVVNGRNKGRFPKGTTSPLMRLFRLVKLYNGLTLELSAAEWSLLDKSSQFIKKYHDNEDFLEWRRQEKWLFQLLPPLQNLIAMRLNWTPDSNAPQLPPVLAMLEESYEDNKSLDSVSTTEAITDHRSEELTPVASESMMPTATPANPVVLQPVIESTNSEAEMVFLECPAAIVNPMLNFPLLLGHDQHQQPIYWDPNQECDNPLINFSLLITGDTGSGKTQLINCLIAACCYEQHAVTIFDFKADYWQPELVTPLGINVYEVHKKGLPFNPMQPPPQDAEGIRAIEYSYAIRDLLKRIFGLGIQQANELHEAIVRAYQDYQIPLQDWIQPHEVSWPSFKEVFEHMHDSKGRRTQAMMRLKELVDLQLFKPESETQVDFETFINGRWSLKLASLPNNYIKGALAEFLIMQIHGYALKRHQPRRLQHLMVFDEAHRVAQNPKLETLVREGRAFGIGVVLGTQFPSDIPDEIANNLATHIYLNRQPHSQRDIVRRLCGTVSSPQARTIADTYQQLQRFQGFINNPHYQQTMLTVIPYYQRTTNDN